MTSVRFGRYKNKPVEHLLRDHNYKMWLKQQSWLFFYDRVLYEILHHPQTPHPPTHMIPNQPTPAHNKIQNKFLDQIFCVRFLKKNIPKRKKWHKHQITMEFEFQGWDVMLSSDKSKTKNFIEIKTTMSDEYPNILRKMKDQMGRTEGKARFFLLVQNFNSVFTDRQTLQTIFQNSGIHVVFGDEMEG